MRPPAKEAKAPRAGWQQPAFSACMSEIVVAGEAARTRNNTGQGSPCSRGHVLRAKTIRRNRPCPTSMESLAPFLIRNRNSSWQERLLAREPPVTNPSAESPEGRTAVTVASGMNPAVTAGFHDRRNQPALRPEELNYREDCFSQANQRQEGGHPRRNPRDNLRRRDACEPVVTRRPDGEAGCRQG